MTVQNTMQIAMLLAEAVSTDSLLRAAAEEAYGRPMTVESGFNRKRAEWGRIAPFAVLVPAASSRMDDGNRTHTVALLLGVADSGVIDGQIPRMRGLDWLAQTALAHALRAMSDALASAWPSCSMREPDVEYVQDDFPMIYCSAALAVVETVPVGGRR